MNNENNQNNYNIQNNQSINYFSNQPQINNGLPSTNNHYLKKKINPFENIEFTTRDLIGFLGSLVSIFIVSYFGILNFFNFGFSLTMAVLAIFGFIFLYKGESKQKGFSLFCLVSALLLIASFSINDDGVVKFVSVLYLIFLLVISFTGISNYNKDSGLNYNWVFNGFIKPILLTTKNIFAPFCCAKKSIKNGKGKKASSGLIGVLVAIPLLFIIVPLLASSDIAFDAIVSRIFENTTLIFVALVITVILLPLFYSLIFYLEKSSKVSIVTKSKVNKMISVIAVNSFLISISVVYLFYIFTQLAYILDAFKFILPDDYTAAEFARSGFFEMAVIVFINFIILAITGIKVKRENSKLPLSTKNILLFISGFTIFYITTAIIKMVKYISLYGLTRLRVLTTIFMLMLAVIFVILILKLLISKLKYVKPIIVVCTLTLLSISMININSVIAEYNYNAYKNDEIKIDVEQIETLGVSGIPILTKLFDEKDYDISFQAKEGLYYLSDGIYRGAFSENSNGPTIARESIFEYNLTWMNSKKALDEFIKLHPEFTEDNFFDERDEYYNMYG